MIDYAYMNQCLYEGKASEVEQMTKDALADGRPVQEIMNDGLIAGMSVVGEDFKHNVLYVPEVLIAARAMKAGMSVLKPLLSAKDSTTKRVGTLLMGTVRGDLHDIGKNLVCMMAEGAGFEVVDIGVDQSVDKFMAAADKCQPTIIGMSALLTTTMTYMKTGHRRLRGGRPRPHQDGGRRRPDQPDVRRRDRRRRLRAERVRGGRPVPAAVAGSRGGRGGGGVRLMATYKVLYWQEVPSQIRVEDDTDDVTLPMPERFQERIDRLAAERGLGGSDDYLAQWQWSEDVERDGSAQDVADAVCAELEAKAGF